MIKNKFSVNALPFCTRKKQVNIRIKKIKESSHLMYAYIISFIIIFFIAIHEAISYSYSHSAMHSAKQTKRS